MVPASLLAFGLDADFGGALRFEQVQGQVSYHRQFLVGAAGSDSAAVFIKGHVQHQWRLFSMPQCWRVAWSRDAAAGW